MKKLNQEQRFKFFEKRKSRMYSMSDTAEVLNMKYDQIRSASIGREIQDEVYQAIIEWIGGDNSE